MGEDLTNREMATKLNISEGAFITHVGHILLKFGVPDRTQALLYAIRNNIIDDS